MIINKNEQLQKYIKQRNFGINLIIFGIVVFAIYIFDFLNKFNYIFIIIGDLIMIIGILIIWTKSEQIHDLNKEIKNKVNHNLYKH